MDQTRTISFNEICEELFVEENRKELGYNFKDYYDIKLKRFKEILVALGVDPELLKGGPGKPFEIPVSHKGYVKGLLNDYKSKRLKAVRKQMFRELPLDEVEELTQGMESLLAEKLDTAEQRMDANKMYVITRLLVKVAVTNLKATALQEIDAGIEKMWAPLDDELTLNDSDKAHLITYYQHLLQSASERWHETLQYVSEVRMAELSTIGDSDPNETLKPIWDLIGQANAPENRLAVKTLKRPTAEEMSKVKNLLNELKQ